MKIQMTIRLELPERIIGHSRIGSELNACVANIPETYPPQPKNAAWPKEIKFPNPRTRFNPIAAIEKIIILESNVIK